VGVALVLGSAFWPTLDVRAYPGRTRLRMVATPGALGAGVREVPAHELGTALVETVRGPDRVRPLWEIRRWYPWFLAPLWALALLLAGGPVGRRLVGAFVLLLSLGIIALEATYLKAEYLAFLPGALGRAEVAGAWLVVITILLYRRRADRHLGAVEAAVGAQALLGFVHGVTLPATMFRQWLPGNDAGVVLEAILHNFTPAFWIGMAGMLIMSLPVYLRRTPSPEGSREEGQ
jgi:hypothetical protein